MLSLKFLYENPLGILITSRKRKKKALVTSALEDPHLEEDDFRAEYVRSIPKAQLFGGVLFQGYMVPSDILEGLENMTIREDDIFIITYPKSGTTWTEELVSLIYNGGDVRRVQKEPLIYRIHHLEVGRPLGHHRYLRNVKSPRLMATHLPFHLLPMQLKEAKCKIIYVVRNPKDTAVSYFHHHRMSKFLGNFSGSWEQFLKHFMAGHMVYGSWFDHVIKYWEFCKRHPSKVFFISYEELKQDLRGMTRRLCTFLQRPVTEEGVATIAGHCSFEQMSNNKMVNREVLPIADMFDMTKSKFMRKGIIGDWVNHFTAEQSEEFDALFAVKMTHCDLPFTFSADDATARMANGNRIISNHPRRSSDDFSDTPIQMESDKEDGNQYQPRHPIWFSWLPFLQVYITPDPLTLDAVR